MEAMHLCCKVPNYKHGASSSNGNLFIPAALTANQYNIETTTPKWRSSITCSLDNDTNYVYMGRRLECENKNLTFLTPGLFPRIQVLFNNTFRPQENADLKLGKHFVSICLPNKEIIVVFCQARSDNVIDVLVRAPLNNYHHDMARTLAYVEDRIINNLITICAQPTGIQGVTLIESVIRPGFLRDPSRAENRVDQCVTMTHLKQQLRSQMEEGESKFCHLWNQTEHMPVSITDPLIDLLGLENYMEVVMSYGAWLKEVRDAILLEKDDETNGSDQHQSHQDATMATILEDTVDLPKVPQEDHISEEGVEVQSCNKMARAILDLSHKLDANHQMNVGLHHKNYVEIRGLHHKMDEISNKLDQIHQELQLTRRDVVTKVQSVVERLLKFAVENEDEKRLPSVVVLTTDGVSKIRKLVTSLSRNHVVSVRVELCCEDRTLPHPVANQRGITITSLSESLSQGLDRALPYINGFLCALTIAAKLGSNYGVPVPASPILELLPYLKDMKQYPMVSSALMDMPVGPSSISRVSPCTSESFKEWQKCLASRLTNNGGLTDRNIRHKFGLKRVKYKNDEGVAWLCDEHSNGHAPFSLGHII